MYTLASKFGANVYIILQFTLATTYAQFVHIMSITKTNIQYTTNK